MKFESFQLRAELQLQVVLWEHFCPINLVLFEEYYAIWDLNLYLLFLDSLFDEKKYLIPFKPEIRGKNKWNSNQFPCNNHYQFFWETYFINKDIMKCF